MEENKDTPGIGHTTFQIKFSESWLGSKEVIKEFPVRPLLYKIKGKTEIVDSRHRLWSYRFTKSGISFLPLYYLARELWIAEYNLDRKPKPTFKSCSQQWDVDWESTTPLIRIPSFRECSRKWTAENYIYNWLISDQDLIYHFDLIIQMLNYGRKS